MWIWVIIFIILALLMPDFHGMKKKEKNHKELLSTIKSTKPSEDTQERFPCPSCAEMVLVQANVCRYCGRDLPEDVKPIKPVKPVKPEIFAPVSSSTKIAIHPMYRLGKFITRRWVLAILLLLGVVFIVMLPILALR